MGMNVGVALHISKFVISCRYNPDFTDFYNHNTFYSGGKTSYHFLTLGYSLWKWEDTTFACCKEIKKYKKLSRPEGRWEVKLSQLTDRQRKIYDIIKGEHDKVQINVLINVPIIVSFHGKWRWIVQTCSFHLPNSSLYIIIVSGKGRKNEVIGEKIWIIGRKSLSLHRFLRKNYFLSKRQILKITNNS